MNNRSLSLRPLLAVAFVAGLATLAGCGSSPQSRTVTTEETTRTVPVPPVVSTTTTTTRQVQ